MFLKKIPFFILYILISSGFIEATPTLTVFIHGTVKPGLAFVDTKWFWGDGRAKKGGNYETLLLRDRNDPDTYQQNMMLSPGFREVPTSLIEAARKGNLSRERSRFGAYYMLAGYDELARVSGFASEKDYYALFGWSGMLDSFNRMEESFKLYLALADWVDEYEKKYGVKPLLRINAYSHGGNVALGIMRAEEHYKRHLLIDQLCLYGTPIQVEMIDSILSPMFKSIILFRSPEGDSIQTLDSVTTQGQSYADMSEIIDLRTFKHENPKLQRADVGIWVNKNGQAVNHYNLFALQENALHEMLELPVVVLAPILLQQINNHPFYSGLRAYILCGKNSIKVRIKTAHEYLSESLSYSDNFYNSIVSIQSFIRHNWSPTWKHESIFDTFDIFDDGESA